jgi:hypothetical protein
MLMTSMGRRTAMGCLDEKIVPSKAAATTPRIAALRPAMACRQTSLRKSCAAARGVAETGSLSMLPRRRTMERVLPSLMAVGNRLA